MQTLILTLAICVGCLSICYWLRKIYDRVGLLLAAQVDATAVLRDLSQWELDKEVRRRNGY
jgi:hypothetical protein